MTTIVKTEYLMKWATRKQELQQLSDEELIVRIAQKDELAFEELCRRFIQWAYRYDYRFLQNPQDAENAVQEKFLNVWKKADLFEHRAGSKAKNYLLKIDKNICLDMLSKSYKKYEMTMSSDQSNYDPDCMEELLDFIDFTQKFKNADEYPALQSLESKEIVKKIYDFTQRSFSSRQFLAFWGFVQGMSYKEISVTYRMEEGSVRGHIARGLKRVRDVFSKEMDRL